MMRRVANASFLIAVLLSIHRQLLCSATGSQLNAQSIYTVRIESC